MSLELLFHQIHPLVEQNVVQLSERWPRYTLFASLSDGKTRARVVHCTGSSFAEVWECVTDSATKAAAAAQIQVCWLRIDWVRSVRQATLGQLKDWLKRVKRNYFRYGLALDEQFNVAFLEQELNSNAMLYGGTQYVHAVLNEKNFGIYARKRFPYFQYNFADENPIFMLDTAGVFCSTEEEPKLLYPKGRDAGRRIVERLDAEDVYGLIDRSSRYLTSQTKPEGRFYYGWHPCFDRHINTYNTLRHASTTYSMVEAWEITKNPELHDAIQKSFTYTLNDLIKTVTLPDGSQAAFLVEHTGTEVKLGANAVCILAFSKYSELTGTKEYLPILELLALGIRYMQNPDTGQFVHVLNFPDLSVKDEFRIIYYDGEAAFGLMRLYGLTEDSRWLTMVEQAFEHFIEAEHWKAHDHWLSYCVNELTLYREEEKYYRFGLQNVTGYLNFIENRLTTFPTLLELIMAAEKMVIRLQASDKYAYLLEGLDITKFYRALEKRAHYLLNGHFWPEYAMYFANPQRILGSLFIRHHAFRVRIDDVEHYLSGFVAYLKYLNRAKSAAANLQDLSDTSLQPMSSEWLAAVTGGTWQTVLPRTDSWKAQGICIHPSTFQPGHLVCAREREKDRYVTLSSIERLIPRGVAGILCEKSGTFADLGVPVLQVADKAEAVLAIGEAARNTYRGSVVGVTGSAGKTTVTAMLAHVLRDFGHVGQTHKSANLPIGIAWNQAGMSQDAAHWVVEMAVGRMAINTNLVKPHVAIVTNVAPAHLVYHNTTQNIAIKKSHIFDGMAPGGVAVVCRDIDHFAVFSSAAEKRGLKLLTYGQHDESDVRLVSYLGARVHGKIAGESISFPFHLHGEHMAINAMGIVAVLIALNLPWRSALHRFESFSAVNGRGSEHRFDLFKKHFIVRNDAYNANPLSMSVALAAIAAEEVAPSSKVVVLGDMLELGHQEQHFHEALKAEIMRAQPDRVILCGPLMKHLWAALAPEISSGMLQGKWFPNVDELLDELPSWLKDGDVVLFKGSNSTGLHKVISKWAKMQGELTSA